MTNKKIIPLAKATKITIALLATISLAACSTLDTTGHNPTNSAPVVSGWGDDTDATATTKSTAPITNADNADGFDSYTVQTGDTVDKIAWSYGIDTASICKTNLITKNTQLVIGQKLLIPRPAASNVAPQVAKQAPKTSDLSWPTSGKVIKTFTPQKSLETTNSRNGIEISGQLGQEVHAVAAGKVIYSGAGLNHYGNLIIIKHSDTLSTVYAFNQQLLVQAGKEVTTGQKIALMGNDTHGIAALHFEVRLNGKPVDPLLYLRIQ